MSQTQQRPQYWNLIRLHLGHRRPHGELFPLLNLYDSLPIVFRIPNYGPHQTPPLLTDRYRPYQTLLQLSRMLSLTLNRPIPIPHTTAAWAIIHISEQMPWRCTSESSQLATLTHVLNSIYSHAVVSHLTASSAVTAQRQPYMERYDLDIWPQMVELSEYMLLTGYHRHTLAGIHQRHGPHKQRRRLRFMSNMLRTCIRAYLLCRFRHLRRRLTQHLLVWDMVIRR